MKIWLPMGVIGGIALAALSLVKFAGPPAPSPDRQPDAGADPRSAAPAEAGSRSIASGSDSLWISFENELLTVRADDVRLKDLLKEISRQAFIAIDVSEDIAANRMSVKFADLPLEQGLRRILAGYDVFTYHRGGTGLLAVWVYGELEGRGLMPVPSDTWASTADLEKRLEDTDPAERAVALESLVERGGRVGKQAVIKALADPDEEVRTVALYGALFEDLELPGEMLTDLASNDTSHNVRFLALKNLAGRPGEQEALEAALNDSNPVVRSYAESVMLRLYPSEDPPENPQLPDSDP